MKRCPRCDFSFADFHHVCDFDGTELVDDPVTLPVFPRVSALVAGSQSPFLRLVKSPLFLTGLAVIALVASALLISYYDSPSQPNSIAKNQTSRDSVVARVAPAPAQPPAQIRTLPPTSSGSEISNVKASEYSSSMRRRSVMASHSRTRFRSSPSIRNQQTRSETALQKESKETAHEMEPKVAVILKTAWHILKKPFKF